MSQNESSIQIFFKDSSTSLDVGLTEKLDGWAERTKTMGSYRKSIYGFNIVLLVLLVVFAIFAASVLQVSREFRLLTISGSRKPLLSIREQI